MQNHTPLKNLIKKIVSDIDEKQKAEADIKKVWERTVDKKTFKHAKPAFLRSKRLVINVSDSAWLYKLTLEKKKLIEGFNKNTKNKTKIKEIQFRVGNPEA
ncbi:MAG: DUF721 domain-containing protein [Candidatus Omnitrophica bacterium]|nr:DUF721 domain-containing protein [Candidatus Omnitrophota bacterium]